MYKIILNLSLAFLSISSFAANQVMVLSGGDNPGFNHYSQYLQTKAMYDYVSQKYGIDNTVVYFGMGNTPNTKTPFPDVHQITVNNSGIKEDHMLPGIIANNQMASKENVLSYFFNSKVSNLTTKDNLLLFISDHGLPNIMANTSVDQFSNNCIDLWHFDKTLTNNFLNSDNLENVCLSKNTLEATLEQIPAKHIIFEMSQCFSGGFQQMSVSWKNGYPSANPKICGFTASMPDHYASGCTADANGPGYRGYERSFTEWYTGKSIPTGKTLRSPATSIWAAHKQALLEDLTVDIPITTSDYYLLQWANAFNKPDFQSRVTAYKAQAIKNIFTNYNQYLGCQSSLDLRDFSMLIEKYDNEIIAKYPQDKAFFNLSLSKQAEYIHKQEIYIDEFSKSFENQAELANELYRNVILPTWSRAINEHSVAWLTTSDYQMENALYIPMMDPRNNLLAVTTNWSIFNSLFLQYLALTNNDPRVIDYNKKRYLVIEKWATSKGLYQVARATKTFAIFLTNMENFFTQITVKEERKQLLKRSYLYHQIIASWATLLEINDKSALDELNGLIECQKTQ